jgi:hypothetical protein
MKKAFSIAMAIFLFSCGQRENKKDIETTKYDNISTTVSTDTSKLSKLIDIDTYKPTSVKFKYVVIDNSGQNQRLSVPGPSDNYLEGILYFDTVTFKNLKATYFHVDYLSPNFDKTDFKFDWLDDDIKNELIKSDTNYHGHPDFSFGLGHSGKLWLLDNKLLLIKSIN